MSAMRVSVRGVIFGSLLCMFLVSLGIGSVSAADTTTIGQVTVTGYDVNPKVFFPGDTGILTIKLKNSGTTPVNIDMPTLLGGEFLFLNSKTMVPIGTLGGGGETSVSLQIKPSGVISSGMAYPYFSVGYTIEGGGSTSNPVRVQIPIQIDSTTLDIQLIEKPNMVAAGSMGKYKLRIGNPRAADITGLSVSIGGQGISTRQEGYFLGTITANNYTDIEIDLAVQGSAGGSMYPSTPDANVDLMLPSYDDMEVGNMDMPVFDGGISPRAASVSSMTGGSGSSSGGGGSAMLVVTADYRNGQNTHRSVVEIPVTASGTSSVVISDLVATKYEGMHKVTGSVYNPGLRDISSVVVVAGPPAIPQGSYQAALGVVEGNDNGEFELKFSVKGTPDSVPIIVTYQDEMGMYHQEQNSVSIINYDPEPTETVSGYPIAGQSSILIPAFVVVGALALGAVFRSRKE